MSQPEQRTPNSQSPTQRNALLALIPNLRAFAFSLTGDSDRADDLAQDTLLKRGSTSTASGKARFCGRGCSPFSATRSSLNVATGVT